MQLLLPAYQRIKICEEWEVDSRESDISCGCCTEAFVETKQAALF